MGRKTDFFT
jgi:hypothetical protein